MSSTDAGGLRERKRRATLEAIERGAVDLALEHGYDTVTVEMICEVAMISQRTFFNYAGSKERAVLGVETPLPDAQLQASFVAGLGGTPLDDLVSTVVAAFSASGSSNAELFRKRRHVVFANPELAIKEFARMEEAQSSLVQLVRDRLLRERPHLPEQELDDEAQMVVVLTFGIVHFAGRELLRAGLPDDVGAALRTAVELARRVVNPG